MFGIIHLGASVAKLGDEMIKKNKGVIHTKSVQW